LQRQEDFSPIFHAAAAPAAGQTVTRRPDADHVVKSVRERRWQITSYRL
jgi:hypothetical protein